MVNLDKKSVLRKFCTITILYWFCSKRYIVCIECIFKINTRGDNYIIKKNKIKNNKYLFS